tara:strand:+ start:4024 stop:4233 length:210 start_codon:yes stop_codon:yes gene_type:complete
MSTEKDIKKEPSNNNKKIDTISHETPTAYIITKEGIDELVICINSLGLNKYAIQTIYAAINTHTEPIKL